MANFAKNAECRNLMSSIPVSAISVYMFAARRAMSEFWNILHMGVAFGCGVFDVAFAMLRLSMFRWWPTV